MIFPWWLFALFVAKGADLATTEILLSAPNFYEANPFMRESSVRYGAMVAGPLIVEWGARKLERRGRKRNALILRIAVIAAWSYFAIHNTRQLE